MAVAAFKSTSKRSLVGPRERSAATTDKGRSDSSQNGAHRRSRSNDASDNFSQSSSSADILLNGQMDFGSTTLNPLFRGSTVLEEASRLLEQSKGDSSQRRGRSLSRIRPNDVNNCQSEAVNEQRRGRSVSRNHSIHPQTTSNQKANAASERRGRSLSCCKHYESESDMDQASSRMGQGQVKNIGIVENKRYNRNKPARDQVNLQQGLRRCSNQQNVSESLDGYSSCVSSVTDNEKSSIHPDVCVEEKTIKSVCEQIKSDHPTGDTDASGLNEAIRSEVQRAVAEIKFDLEQAIEKKSPSPPPPSGSISAPQFKSKDDIREEYIAQLLQSEKRARDLWAQFAEEEKRCQELTKIVKNLLPDPQLSQNQKPSRTRKNSAERRKMSKRLTEAAENYFDECVSISTFEDSEMSSLEELENHSPAQDVRREKERSYMGSTQDISSYKVADGTFYSQQFPVHLETDGVALPNLNCETNYNLTTLNRQNSEITSDEAAKNARIEHSKSNRSSSDGRTSKGKSLQNTSDFSQRSIESKMSFSTRNHADKTKNKNLEKKVQSFGNATQEGSMKSRFVESSSSYQDDEFLSRAYNDAILIENLKVKSIIDFGGLLLCNKLHI
ncbi:uncharacterized protein LOC131076867 isoform X1 [Cryptomeria japonica]|uniref:uncharacterized protein LOC131076867 isoform X1 n=1 Tax=Cryptomeria japonica TaxID=3369 RepID=UPI0025ACD81A|nr:uncharacterized protein LOC131076867 isoform X1 [Cryptomeria japonica]XP_057870187.1 uncharacterized protein LOC131076867 isoform X1 [Cryptomeria japonica]XP_057870188.1 uncharacterized protein LOC131076867 isoform X1 [Cryptomeria japonica]XP_057870189.1 uncharacterized protein LOC131076867 isoform X1 [Cryptomeria japonica]XP_057870190.1 uncharacterized protein LOC131076867 isoform X1 [Cryptomeria japonica]XP_057870191.1 uncharacterized protein LOC131076867 isoform X1 [Cryptomeria japonica]